MLLNMESNDTSSSRFQFTMASQVEDVPSECGQTKCIGLLQLCTTDRNIGSTACTPAIAIADGEQGNCFLFIANAEKQEIEMWEIKNATGWDCSFQRSIHLPYLSSLSRLACELYQKGSVSQIVLWITCPEKSLAEALELFPENPSNLVGCRQKLEDFFKPVAIAVSETKTNSSEIAIVDASSGHIHVFRRQREKVENTSIIDNDHTKTLSSTSLACFDNHGTLWVSSYSNNTVLKRSHDDDTKIYKDREGLQGIAFYGHQSQLIGCIPKKDRVVAVDVKNGQATFKDFLPRGIQSICKPLFLACSSKLMLCVVSGRSKTDNLPVIGLIQVQ